MSQIRRRYHYSGAYHGNNEHVAALEGRQADDCLSRTSMPKQKIGALLFSDGQDKLPS